MLLVRELCCAGEGCKGFVTMMVVPKVDLEIFLECRIRKDDKELTLRSKHRDGSVLVGLYVVESDT